MSSEKNAGLNAWQLTLQVHRELTHLLDDHLKSRTGLDIRTYEVLFYLSNAPDGELGLTQLSESLLLRPAAATRFFDRMERAALSRRRKAKSDRRAVVVKLTGRGRSVFEAAQPLYSQLVRTHFGRHLGDQEAADFDAALDRVLGALRQHREAPNVTSNDHTP
ncbi:MAG: MarR family transcriptional regulator [Acidimicrobiia bacterium]|nr:MarR family transcriptional regulator [Acidimicrobiia bacterium]MBT8216745.1 MarR family transcriptional regulator [Acidimicrobiia bacterium]NNL69773.1 MarR family transcriptional regulator [Acidimicrobiia bacterium]